MKGKISAVVLGLAFTAIGGCAGTGTTESAKPLAVTWEAENRVAKVNFHDNHASCTQAAESVTNYEVCMASLGYLRVD